jgi:flavin-binding protein dodecin
MSNHVYKTVTLTGSSKTSIEDAVNSAVAKAAQSVRNLRWLEITETRGVIENQKLAYWQVTMNVGFTLED